MTRTRTLKRGLLLASVLGASAALAQQTPTPQPFVWPNEWSVATPQQAVRGGDLRGGQLSDYKSFNPFTSAEADAATNVMGGGALFTQDPRNNNFVPYAAQTVQVQNGGRRFLITIRQGMKFSDGREITAQDYVTTAQIHKDPAVGSNSRNTWYIAGNEITVRAAGRYQLVFDFPTPIAEAYLRMSGSVWPDHVWGARYRQGGAAAIRAFGSLNTPPAQLPTAGMWALSQYRPGERTLFRKNQFWGEWNRDAAGQPLPYLDSLSVTNFADLNAWLAAFVAGQVDTFNATTAEHLQQIVAARTAGRLNATVIPNVSPRASSAWITWNWNRASDPFKQTLFRDVRFRRAMSHLTNREAMSQLVYGGLATPTYYSVYPVFGSWIPGNLPRFEYNLQAAQNLLAQMGFTRRDAQGVLVNSQGRRLEFNLMTNAGNNQREQLMRIFADEAAKIGVRVNAQAVDFNQLVDRLNSTGPDRQWDAILLGFSGSGNIWPFGVNTVPCDGSLHAYNRSGQCLTPQETLMTQLYHRGAATLDGNARRQIGAQLLRTESELQPVVYLVAPNWHVTYNARLGGEFPRPLMNAYYGAFAGADTLYQMPLAFIRR